MNANTIFTIGRQFGSNGRKIGKALADRTGLPYYDAELITHAAEISGLLEDTVRKFDEKAPENKWHPYWFMPFPVNFEPLGQQIFNAQFKALENIANKGGAVIVGRCADYVLRDQANVINVFIKADMQHRVARAIERGADPSKAEDVVRKADKQRAGYYNYYATTTWGDVNNYDLCVDTGKLGYDGAAEVIIGYLRLREKLLREGAQT